LERQFAQGTLRTTALTETFSPDEYAALHAGGALPLFAIDRNGRLMVSTADSPIKP